MGEEPEEIWVGDLVWWNEGGCVGFVEEVMEEPFDFERWGLIEPSIALTNLHPFEANKTKPRQHIGSVTSGGTVVYSMRDLEDEGIGLLSEHERFELAWATAEAKERAALAHRNLPFCVTTGRDRDGQEEDWRVSFVDRACRMIETVVIPFRPETRTTDTAS